MAGFNVITEVLQPISPIEEMKNARLFEKSLDPDAIANVKQ